MAVRDKRKIAKQIQGLPLYAPLKQLLESQGIDSATAGQTSWLFVSLLFAFIFGSIAAFVLPFLKLKHHIFADGEIIARIFCFSMLIHAFIVMVRLKYLITNALFFAEIYVIFIVLQIKNVAILLSIGGFLFFIYMVVPIYSWRIKILDGILYFMYALVFYYAYF